MAEVIRMPLLSDTMTEGTVIKWNRKEGDVHRALEEPVRQGHLVRRGKTYSFAHDRIQQAGGYISVNTGGVPDANEIPIPKKVADEAFDAAGLPQYP
jgi:hypothetical protein